MQCNLQVTRNERLVKFRHQELREPLIMREVFLYSWFRVGIDLFSCGENSYFVAFDACSNYSEAERVQCTSSGTAIGTFSSWFARHGIVAEACTDNGHNVRFMSSLFFEFMTSTRWR